MTERRERRARRDERGGLASRSQADAGSGDHESGLADDVVADGVVDPRGDESDEVTEADEADEANEIDDLDDDEAGPAALLRLELDAAAIGDRLDRALTRALAAAGRPSTRSQLARAFAAGGVNIDGRPVKPSLVLQAPRVVDVVLCAPEPLRAEPEALPLTIVYEDADLLVIDKAAGMVVHAGPGHPRGTLVNAVLFHLGLTAEALPVLAGNDATRPGIVHRLDRDTSGLLVVAKHLRAQEGLARQFRARTITRRYLGIVAGVPGFDERVIETLHGRDPGDRRRFSHEVDRGRRAASRVTVLRRLTDAALCRFVLATGRTHQIRMHARALGHPIVGDPLYGPGPQTPRLRKLVAGLGRHALHAATLGFRQPITGAALDFTSPLPPELQRLLDALGGGD